MFLLKQVYVLGVRLFEHVAFLSSFPRTAATSCVIWALICVPKSLLSVVGRYECLQRMSIFTRATAVAVMWVTGYVNKYLEKASIAVML